ncbi:alginate export family protein [Capnocytophaga gingivalis]|uniref:alginate export family protein n=1 Tax=Capnocytophaga gingivalis TaxID=1017 RepID=UPI003C6C74BC
MNRITFFSMAMALAPLAGMAQEQGDAPVVEEKEHFFTLSGQLRPRFEYRNGAYQALQEGEEPAILVNNRLRLNMDYRFRQDLQLYVSLQQVNIWGQAPQIQVIDRTGGLSVFEAYAALPLGGDFDLKLGRQQIVLDEDRIFGSLDWHPAGRAHDAVNINWRPVENLYLRSFFAFNQNYLDGKAATDKINGNVNNPKGQYFTPGQPYQHMEALHAHYAFTPDQKLSFLFANLGLRNNDRADYNMQTFGVHYRGRSQDLSYGAEAYLQTGKNNIGATKEAYLLAAMVGYKFLPTLSATMGIDYLSGNNSPDTSGKDKVFTPFSGTNHKFYGFMDYYYVSYTPQVGLFNPYISATLKTSEKGNLYAAGHYFRSAGKIDGKSRNLGVEADLVYTHKLQPFASLQVGYSVHKVSGSYNTLRGFSATRPWQDWFWCSININPTMLKL